MSQLARMATSSSPLYFTVKEAHEVMPTEQPCDLAYEFGDGLLDLRDYPEGFPLSGEITNFCSNYQVYFIIMKSCLCLYYQQCSWMFSHLH